MRLGTYIRRISSRLRSRLRQLRGDLPLAGAVMAHVMVVAVALRLHGGYAVSKPVLSPRDRGDIDAPQTHDTRSRDMP